MKHLFAFLVLFSLLLMVNLIHARREPEDYWRNVMKDQPLPEAIKNLMAQDQTHLVKDFDTRSNAIIYHSHGHEQDKREDGSFVERVRLALKALQLTWNHE
ncbi:hypothetical protein K2173_002392 [Erythroxylum novogranatense]|uniref:Organ specific protein n=1 Tax=Erythroxylum novogranatense TaxID=1862640 RepID=A0AAV8TB29_9ROSI|nr:hypothetical protein K2173_002392 [Erythroxylum novogranatense]